jgi:hypothetical protein|tara:strand:- start:23 stop:490 length:468 start_codon:yes stop_codon:yes gene_type:complete
MGQTTFTGPVRSERGFTAAGSNAVVEITTETTLTYADHVGRIIEINDADGAVTLPTITSDTIGAEYTFFIGTDSTDLDIKTNGTDKFSGTLAVAGTTTAAFASAVASNDVISMNGTTTGGDAGSNLKIVAIGLAEYLVSGTLMGSGTVATPFADS